MPENKTSKTSREDQELKYKTNKSQSSRSAGSKYDESVNSEGKKFTTPVCTTMEALNEIDEFYSALNRKHEKEIKKLNQKSENQQENIKELEKNNRNQRERLTEIEREISTGVTEKANITVKISRLEKRNSELKADRQLKESQYEELKAKYDELLRKQKANEHELKKTTKEIHQMKSMSQRGNEDDNKKYLQEKIANDEKVINDKDREIKELKEELNKVQRKSNKMREKLRSKLEGQSRKQKSNNKNYNNKKQN